MSELPSSWVSADLAEIISINPGVDKSQIDADATINFVAMPAVEAETGRIDVSEERTFAKVRTGYTPFLEADVLFAKITPCMENGKMAVVPSLPHGVGFGSTEFHVFRCPDGVEPKYIYYHTSAAAFRHDAEHNMTGAVGQKRVPEPYLATCSVPLPPTNEQRRIVAKIEELFSELDKGVESLKLARAQLKLYRQSVLKHAFEGKLTADWREANPGKLEAPETLLARIQAERDARYKQQLDDWNDAVAAWRANGEEGKKPRKPRKPKRLPDFALRQDKTDYPWPTTDVRCLLAEGLINGRSVKDRTGGFPVLRLTAIRDGTINLAERKEGAWNAEDAEPYLVAQNDVFVARGNGSRKLVGMGGRVISQPDPVAFPDTMIRLRLDPSAIDPEFFILIWNSQTFRRQIENAARTTAGIYKINQDHIGGFHFPLPSLSEQREIVAQIDHHLDPTSVVVVEAETSLKSVDALRQSILKQAFSGKLVPQDPSDEPASALLERIKADKATAKKPRRRRAAA